MSELRIDRMAHALGAKVTGVDLREPLDDATFKSIKSASLEHLLLCFPKQNLTREQMIAFAARFGVVDDNSSVKHRDPKNPYVTMISSKPFEGKPWEGFKNGENWHTDRSFKVGPTSYTLLHAQELPPVGGNTLFANQYMSYNGLSPKLRAFVDDLSAIHLQQRKAAAMMAVQFPAVIHPLARPHPETKRRALYLGEHVRGFVDMTEDESRPFLDFLSAHAIREEYCYRHVWNVRDLVMWDNRCLMHVAVKDYDMKPGAPPRHLWKVSIQGEVTGRLYEDVVGRRYDLEIAERPASPPTLVRATA
jgi:taurine dioxygenase